MSFILDALRKAEQERGFGEIPGLDSLHEQQPQRSPRRWPWVLVAALLLNALIVGALWLRGWGGTSETTSQDVRPAEPVAEGAPGQGPVRPPVAMRSGSTARVETAVPPVVSDSTGAAAALAAVPPTGTAPRPLQPLPLPQPQVAAAPARAAPPQARQFSAPVPETSAALPIPRDVIELRAPSPPPPPPAEPAWKDLPLWPLVPDKILRQVQGRLVLNAHVYSEYPGDRFVLLNMRKYREGDRIEEGPQLEEITLDGVIFTVPNGRFRLKWRR